MATKSIAESSKIYRDFCVIMIWLTVFYSSIIQFVFKQIPYGMLILGIMVLISFYISNIGSIIGLSDILTVECRLMLAFMAYMLTFGYIFAINRNGHLSQWITCLEYVVILIVISSVIKCSGTDSFYYMLFFNAFILSIIFLWKPVEYDQGRYSIAMDMNPNGLGTSFAAGVWSISYIYQKKKIHLLLSALLVVLFAYCILLTGSRKALIAAGLTIIVWLFICYLPMIRKKEGNQYYLAFVIMGIVLAASGYLFISLYNDSTMANRMDVLKYESTEGIRADMYRTGFKMFLNNPLFGLGFQGFRQEYGSYSHATLVEIPVSGGIIGSILYFSMYYISIKKVVILYKQTERISEFVEENMRLRIILVLWIVMLFYTTCVIHQYQFESFVLLGIIFGDTAYIEDKVNSLIATTEKISERKRAGSKYIRYE